MSTNDFRFADDIFSVNKHCVCAHIYRTLVDIHVAQKFIEYNNNKTIENPWEYFLESYFCCVVCLSVQCAELKSLVRLSPVSTLVPAARIDTTELHRTAIDDANQIELWQNSTIQMDLYEYLHRLSEPNRTERTKMHLRVRII